MDEQVLIAVAPPGQGYVAVNALYYGMMRRPGVEIAFQDAVGNNWVRKAMGELIEIGKSTVGYYEIRDSNLWLGLLLELPQDELLDSESGSDQSSNKRDG